MYEHNESGCMFRAVVTALKPLGYDWGTLVGSFGKAIEGPKHLVTHYYGPYQTAGSAKRRLSYLLNFGIVQPYAPNLHVISGRVEACSISPWEEL